MPKTTVTSRIPNTTLEDLKVLSKILNRTQSSIMCESLILTMKHKYGFELLEYYKEVKRKQEEEDDWNPTK